MKSLLIPACLGLLLAASAAPLGQTTAVQTQPDPESPAIGYLKAGSEPVAAPESVAETPAGWMAVSLPGPFTAYVQNQDLTKGLDVRPGASLYLEPNPGAGVLTVAIQGDKISLTGLHGKWMQIRVDRPVTGYIHLGPLPPAAMPAGAAPAEPPPPAAVVNATGPGQAAPVNPDATVEAPRFFQGKFASTHHLIGRKPPYPWQLNGSDGSRAAYLDVSHLLLTDQIENYAGFDVEVYGKAVAIPGTKDFVIEVETLRLK